MREEIERRSGLELVGSLPPGERVISMVTVGLTNDLILACSHGVFVWNTLGRHFDPIDLNNPRPMKEDA